MQASWWNARECCPIQSVLTSQNFGILHVCLLTPAAWWKACLLYLRALIYNNLHCAVLSSGKQYSCASNTSTYFDEKDPFGTLISTPVQGKTTGQWKWLPLDRRKNTFWLCLVLCPLLSRIWGELMRIRWAWFVVSLPSWYWGGVRHSQKCVDPYLRARLKWCSASRAIIAKEKCKV